MIDFTQPDYLKTGTVRQQQAYRVLTQYRVLEKLALFDPILTGTIPLNIAIETSDLDLICCFADAVVFQESVRHSFGGEKDFKEFTPKNPGAVAASFWLDGFELEIFGQAIPTQQQPAYRHMLVEHKILTEQGEVFRQQIIELKKQGYKTEPAFGKLLGIHGNVYEELLKWKP